MNGWVMMFLERSQIWQRISENNNKTELQGGACLGGGLFEFAPNPSA